MISAPADARMADSTSQTNTSPLTGPSSFGSAFDAQGLPTVHEVAYHKTDSHDLNDSVGRRPSMGRPSGESAVSHNESVGSSFGRNFDDKLLEAPPLPSAPVAPATASAVPNSLPSFEEKRDTMINGNGHSNGIPHRQAPQREPPKTDQHRRLSKSKGSRKEKRGGFRNTIRRMLGIQRSPKDRISMPNPAVYPSHNPEEFITSATAVDHKPQRSASVPVNAVPRRSALNSHPPSAYSSLPAPPLQPQNIVPPHPDRRPPERPPRPRSASVPSVLIKDMQALEAARITDQNAQEIEGSPAAPEVEVQNIGFAVTNGSNPKRRSRSVGASPSVDHRMSPIQWHHIRRRSDEIRYWRESAHVSTFGGLKSVEPPEEVPETLAKGDIEDAEDPVADEPEDENELGEHNEQFNFGLPADTSPMQNQERMGLEERLITLEIKLMDFEYALSKLQAGSASSRQNSNIEGKRLRLVDSDSSLNAQQTPNAASPAISQGPMTHSISHKPSVENLMNPKPRPTSVATTIKQGSQSGIYTSPDKPPTDRTTMRASLTNLTIEHYTTLITLIRHEAAARQRLEEQLIDLQAQVDRQATIQRNYSSTLQHSSSQQSHSHSHSFSRTSSRRHGMIDAETNRRLGPYMQQQQHQPHQQQRSSSYSPTETTDDDESDYHDVYVTPNITPIEHPTERGEYERGAFDRMPVGEGVAF